MRPLGDLARTSQPADLVSRIVAWLGFRGGLLFAALLVVAAVGGVSSGCADKSRTLREGEALQYKRELLQSRPRDLSPQYVERFLYSPARTKGDINAVFDDYAQKSTDEEAVDRAQFSRERSAESGSSGVNGVRAGASGGSSSGSSGAGGGSVPSPPPSPVPR